MTQPSVVLEIPMLHFEKLFLAFCRVLYVNKECQLQDVFGVYENCVEAVLMIVIWSWVPCWLNYTLCCIVDFFTPCGRKTISVDMCQRYTVGPPNNGHVGEHFLHCSDVVPSSEVEMFRQYIGRGKHCPLQGGCLPFRVEIITLTSAVLLVDV